MPTGGSQIGKSTSHVLRWTVTVCSRVALTTLTSKGSLFYANALIDTENAFLKFLKTHVDINNVQKRAEKVYENAQS